MLSGARLPLSESNTSLIRPTVEKAPGQSGFSPGVHLSQHPILSPASCWLKRSDGHSSGLSCNSLSNPHPSGSWHFLSPGTQGFLAAFKMSESIVERLWIYKGEPAPRPLESSKLQSRRGQSPEPLFPSLQETQGLCKLGHALLKDERDSSPVGLGNRGVEQTSCLPVLCTPPQQGTLVGPDPNLLVMSE